MIWTISQSQKYLSAETVRSTEAMGYLSYKTFVVNTPPARISTVNSFVYLHKTNPVCFPHHYSITFVPSEQAPQKAQTHKIPINWNRVIFWTFKNRLFLTKKYQQNNTEIFLKGHIYL